MQPCHSKVPLKQQPTSGIFLSRQTSFEFKESIESASLMTHKETVPAPKIGGQESTIV